MTILTRSQLKRERKRVKEEKRLKKKKMLEKIPRRRSVRGPPPLRLCSGTYASLFRDEEKQQERSVLGRKLVPLHSSPSVYYIENFLTPIEIEYIRQMSKRRFRPSYTDTADGVKILSKERTSTFIFLKKFGDTITRNIETRASEIVGLPSANVEPLQIVSYRKDQYFEVHHDLGPWDESENKVEFLRRPTRLATFFVYVNTLPDGSGGHTEFPSLGLSVRPVEGAAVLWSNVRLGERDGSWVPDERTVHRGCPVLEGRKLGMNIWITDQSQIGFE